MAMKKSKKPKFGDIIEIPTIKGFAYALYTHDDLRKYYDEMIRVLPGFFSTRPECFDFLVQEGEQFTTFTSIRLGLRYNQAEIVGNVAIPEWAKARPRFKAGSFPMPDGSCDPWWILNEHGLNSTCVGKLTPEFQNLPLEQLDPISCVAKKKVLGWTNSDDNTFWSRVPNTQERSDNIFWCIPKSLHL